MLKLPKKFEAFNNIRHSAVVASAMIFFAATAGAQSRRAEHKGPRGIAVIEFAHAPAAAQPPAGRATLLPVTIYYNGAYHDASLYEATPEPMAIQTGTVYEVQRDGEALGLFTITMPKPQEDSWYAAGSWQPNAPENATAKETPKKSGAAANTSDDERPTLKRSSSERGRQPASSSPAPSSTTPTSNAPAASSSSSTSSSDQQEKTSAATPPAGSIQQEAPTTAAPAYGAEEQDPNRPLLRRGKPQAEAEPTATRPSSAHPVASKTEATRAGRPSPENQSKSSSSAVSATSAVGISQNAPAAFVGISDTETSDERPYKYPWTKEQQTKLTAQMSKLALEKARKYEQKRNLPASASWEQSSLRAYDLFTNNDGELIFSGAQNIGGPRARTVYVTFAALYDAAGELEPLFSDVTDSEQLDVKGRLELIDAVDSTGDGRGDLLFRRVGISSQKFELYRVVSDGFYKLFEGAVAPI